MDYYITAVNNNSGLLGSANQTIVRDAKTFRKVQNALNSFNPDRQHDKIEVYTFTSFYDEKTFKLIKTITI